MSVTSTELPLAVVVDYADLKSLDESLQAAAARLNLNKSKQLLITLGGSRKHVSVQLEASTKRSLPPITPSVVPKKTYVHASTQTESSPPRGTMLTSVMMFAPYELKKGMQIKVIQVGIVDASGNAHVATTAR